MRSAPEPASVRALLTAARARLEATPFGAPPREATLLLSRILGWSEAQLLARDGEAVPEAAAERFQALLERRLTGEPVAYLLGEREFYGRPFRVDPRVLIPRPETEHLVEAALARALPRAPLLLDVGTGSGILAVTLALEIPGARVVATDLSFGALAVAADNARRLGAHLMPVRTDLAAGLDLSRFDLVVSNPPYIDPGEAPSLSPEVREFEPHLALFAPGRGDSVLERLFGLCTGLRSGVRLLVEIGHGQLDTARRHAEASDLLFDEAVPDYAGIPRVVILRRR